MTKLSKIVGCIAFASVTAALTFAKSLPVGTATVTPLGWASVSANINGAGTPSIDNNGVNTLPPNVSASIVNGGISMVASAGAPVTRRSYYNPKSNIAVSALLSFKVSTTEAFPETLKWTLVGEEWLSASAYAHVEAPGCSSKSQGFALSTVSALAGLSPTAGAAITNANAAYPSPVDQDNPVGPKKKKRSVPVVGVPWLPDGGNKSCVIKVAAYLFGGSGSVIDPIGGPGRLLLLNIAGGAGGYAFYPSGAKSNAGSVMMSVAVPPGRPGINAVLYNAAGTQVDE